VDESFFFGVFAPLRDEAAVPSAFSLLGLDYDNDHDDESRLRLRLR